MLCNRTSPILLQEQRTYHRRPSEARQIIHITSITAFCDYEFHQGRLGGKT